MGPCPIEVGDIAIEHALELFLMKDQQVVQAFLSYAPQKPLTDRIGSGSVIGGLEQLDATGPRHSLETGSILAVVITDQIFRPLPIRGRFSQLLGPFWPTDAISSQHRGAHRGWLRLSQTRGSLSRGSASVVRPYRQKGQLSGWRLR